MNKFNPMKLMLSKWTAVQPKNREKHFIVTELIRDEQENIIACQIEAVVTGKSSTIDWVMLKDSRIWSMGWN